MGKVVVNLPSSWSVSAQQLASRCENKVQGWRRFETLSSTSSCSYGAPPTRVGFEIIQRSVATGMYYTGMEITMVDFRLYNVQYCVTTRRFIRAMVVTCRCHGRQVKDVHPATRRCARQARLSFPKVPSFCSLESPGHITHVNNVVPGKQDVVTHLHLINSQLMSWASVQVNARSTAPVRTWFRLPVS
jgi:hypothetical protein